MAQNISTKTFLVDIEKMPEYLKSGRYWAVLSSWVRRISAAMRREVRYVQKSGRFLTTGENCPLQTGHN